MRPKRKVKNRNPEAYFAPDETVEVIINLATILDFLFRMRDRKKGGRHPPEGAGMCGKRGGEETQNKIERTNLRKEMKETNPNGTRKGKDRTERRTDCSTRKGKEHDTIKRGSIHTRKKRKMTTTKKAGRGPGLTASDHRNWKRRRPRIQRGKERPHTSER